MLYFYLICTILSRILRVGALVQMIGGIRLFNFLYYSSRMQSLVFAKISDDAITNMHDTHMV
jgi:hypothetical protein